MASTGVSREEMLAGVLVAGTAAMVLLRARNHAGEYETFPASDFFHPELTEELAASLDATLEDDFILNAWNYVGSEVTYESTPSDIEFEGEYITCLYCYSVKETLARTKGNCVNKSALLASILLTRLEPARVKMIIGGFALDGVGGHAWLNVERGGDWYLIEATSPPKAMPWVPVSVTAGVYLPYAVFSPASFECLDHSVCLKVGACDCGRRIPELWG